MTEFQEENIKWFGEWIPLDGEDKEEARKYLKSWKKYLLRKLACELSNYEPYDGRIVDGDKKEQDPEGWYEHWIERNASMEPLFRGTLGLKFAMRKKLPY